MKNLDVTIAVVPHERFSFTGPSLESIFANTPPVPLVYVDGGSPARVARYLRRQADERGFKLVRTDYYLTPNQARNLALGEVRTKYVVFLDNDVSVCPGWLEALVECAEETGAWIVGPLTMYDSIRGRVIHAGARGLKIEEVNGHRVFSERNDFADKKLEEVPALKRQQTEQVEFHCMLLRRECLESVGRLDEKLLCTREHCDICFTLRDAGGQIFFEPAAMVEIPGSAVAWSDLPYYFLHWSDAWGDPSIKHFKEKWRIAADDPNMALVGSWITEHRQAFLWQLRPFFDRLTGGRGYGVERLILAPLALPIARLVARKAARRGKRSRSANTSSRLPHAGAKPLQTNVR